MTVRPPGATSILQSVEKRGETDGHPSYFIHVVLPFLITLLSILIAVGVVIWQLGSIPSGTEQIPEGQLGIILGAVGLGVIGILAAAVLVFRGWYLLIKRRNKHLSRDRVLRQGILDYARRVAETEGGEEAGEHLETMQRLHNEALLEENERPAVVHILLYALTNGLWGLYVLYFLLKDVPQHARRQGRFVQGAREVFDEAGRDADQIPTIEPIQERSYLLSVAMWIFLPIVGGFIVTWWLYKDPPQHFERQWVHEDHLVELVREAEAPQPPEQRAGAPSPGAGPSEPSEEEEGEGAPEDEAPEFTIWPCPECAKKYKVPPKRPVRVTCKNCGHKEILQG